MTKRNRWEADGPDARFRPRPDVPWKCLNCHAVLPEEPHPDGGTRPVPCPLPDCVEKRRANRRWLGLPEGGLHE